MKFSNPIKEITITVFPPIANQTHLPLLIVAEVAKMGEIAAGEVDMGEDTFLDVNCVGNMDITY